MNYSRGRAGPIHTNRIEIRDVFRNDGGPNGIAQGDAVVELRDGSVKGVSFTVQGGNRQAMEHLLHRDATLTATLRWTGSTAVTITKVHGGEAGTGVPTTGARRQADLKARAEALFG